MSLAQQLERLARLGFELLPAFEIQTHYVIERDGFVALVERTPEGFGQAGSPGVLTGNGFAVLVWRNELAFFVAKGYEQAATGQQVIDLRRFSSDLKLALADETESRASNRM